MTDRFKDAKDWYIRYFTGIYGGYIPSLPHHDAVQEALTLATESEQLRKRLAELETLLAQANKKIQWYERTEATND